ncbi:uncharacterized protein [Miscanthus floridulus]|uniref:uncharacterized protein n=1 Tax=Miscanthus floridulus TaxID=154761 RepID=UPI0034598BA5
MAELALGLTKTVVEGALSQIQWAIEEEEKLKEGVQQDLEFITGEFQMMQSFLKVVNKERAKKNEVVRAWVRQLRDLAFDVEDWVEFVAHLDKDKSLCSCLWRLVPSWAVPRRLAPPRHLDEAAAEMKLLKARVHDVSQRNARYNLFNSDDSGSSSGLDSSKVAVTTPSTIANILSITAFEVLRQVWRHETHRLRQVDSLTNLITSSQVEGDDLEVIWLWGADDRYASDHIHMAYHDSEIWRSFERRAWVKITRPFNLQVFLNTLVTQLLFVGSSHEATNSLTSTEFKQQVTMEQRYLVVLEDLSDLVEWNTIRMYLPDNKKGSRIVVSTQNLRHAILCMREPYLVSEVGRFSDGCPSICAFYRKVITTGQSDSYMDILIGKIKRGGVISVYGHGPRKSRVVKNSYLSIMVDQNRGELDSMRFNSLIWVPLARNGVPSRLVEFSPRLLLALSGFHHCDLEELFDAFVGHISFYDRLCEVKEEEELIERSRKFLQEYKNCLVVIDGLRSKKGWDDLVKSAILPDEANKCCVVVVTDDQTVAGHCVGGNKDLLVHVSEVQEEMPPGPNFGCRRLKLFDRIESKSHPSLAKRCKDYNLQITNKCVMGGTPRSPAVASVWGIAGSGKSALAGWSFTDSLLYAEYPEFNHYCWVDVPHPFHLAELCLGLLHEFPLKDPWRKEQAMISILQGDRDPIQECRLALHQNKWLLVLDGLRSTDEWDTINDAFCLSQPTDLESKTIVITNKKSVAMHCVNKEDKRVVSVQALEADEALNLFNEKIHNNNIDLEPSDMKHVSELSKSIMAKCGGLPKVIDVVANHYNMSYKEPYLKLKDINDNFMHILEGFHSLRGLFSWMQSYMETCKDDLKPCIFYLPVFPIGHSIRSRRLVWRWVAEGYIRDTSSHTTDKNIEMLLSELWESSMFQLQESSKPVKCQVNGFVHEYINSRPMEDNLVFALDGPCSMQSQRAGGQHLTVRDNWDRDMNVFQSIDFSRLRSLTVFGKCRPFMFDPKKIKMRYVRVLDLEDASGVTNDDLKHIVEVFPRLKFLSLRGCTKISRLPKSLGRLRQLQTLDVRHTSVATLPNAILKLQKLQNVRAGTIHSAPWDEGGIMVPYQTKRPEEIISTLVPPEDAAATPSAPEEDATTVAATPSSSASKDATTIATAPLSPQEVTTAVAAALWAQTEDRTTVAVAPSAPEEDARTGTTAPSALEEDPAIVVADSTALGRRYYSSCSSSIYTTSGRHKINGPGCSRRHYNS